MAKDQSRETSPTTAHQSMSFFARLLGTRPGWPAGMTAEEQAVMGEHFVYLRDLTARKKVLMAGPCLDPVFGLIVLQVESAAEARAILEGDPSVKARLHTYDLNELKVALRAHHVPPERYAESVTGRVLHKEVVVSAPRAEVWRAWTTTAGLRSWFTPWSTIELRIGGRIEILFGMDSPPGQRGSEDCRILSFLPAEMLSFEWNAPPSLGAMRWKHTHVVLHLEDAPAGKTRVRFDQLGWGEGENWNAVYEYFDSAWEHVLRNLERRFTDGPLFTQE